MSGVVIENRRTKKFLMNSRPDKKTLRGFPQTFAILT
jgi:hypothetical protein